MTLKNVYYKLGSTFLTTYFKYFVFMELFDLNSNLNNLFESSSVKDFLVDSLVNCLVDLVMLPISTKILKFSLAD